MNPRAGEAGLGVGLGVGPRGQGGAGGRGPAFWRRFWTALAPLALDDAAESDVTQGQSRLLWGVDCVGHGTQLELDEAGGYAAVVLWL